MPALEGLEIHQLCDKPELIPEVAKWFWQEWPDVYRAFGQHSEADTAKYITDCNQTRDKLPFLFVMTLNGQCVASGGLDSQDVPSGPYSKVSPWVVCMFTAPSFRRRGFASRMFQHVCNYAFEHLKLPWLWLWTHGSCFISSY